MTLPAYWWLLAFPVVVQGVFFARFAVVRLRGKALQSLSGRAAAALYASAVTGLAYGAIQRDPLFVVGQGCLLIVYYRMQNPADGDRAASPPRAEDRE